MIGRRPSIVSALEALKPKSEWTLRGETYADLEWLDKSQTKPTEEQVTAKIAEIKAAEPMTLLRDERNILLAQSDWTQLPDAHNTLINGTGDMWKDYRQALRDLPSVSNPKLDSFGNLDMSSVSWPSKPS